MRVLVIDDQSPVRTAVCEVLRDLGVELLSQAASGRAALAAVAEPAAHFDLILCDLRMPDRDGIETIRAFAAMGIECAVAIMSVEDDRVIEIAGTLASLQGLRLLGTIRKPVTAHNLAPLLDRVFDSVPHENHDTTAPEDDLERAFLSHELQLFYQPQVEWRSNRVVGVEALVRWQHPTLGVFQPSAFMPALKRSDKFMAWLTEFSLEEGIAFAARSRRRQQPLRVAINLSARAFEALDLPERLDGITRHHGVPPGDITVEITETEVSRNPVRLADVAMRLHLKGFRLSVDDFGMGQSGLAQLQQVPFTELKIDRAFVAGCATSTLKRSVVETSLALARTLQMLSVAEGVETQDDVDTLSALDCDVFQGYFYARPMCEDDLVAWLARWPSRPAESLPAQPG